MSRCPHWLIFALLISMLFAGCDKRDKVEPLPKYIVLSGFPSSWVEAKENNSQIFSVLVLGADSLPKSDVDVFFSIDSKYAKLKNTTDQSNSSGIATTEIIFGTVTGEVVVTAQAFGLTGSPITFHYNVTSSTPEKMVVFSGDGLAAPAGQLPGEPLGVKVTDKYDNPVQGVVVTFKVVSGGGSLQLENVYTDQYGIAQTQFTTGDTNPVNTIEATIAGNISVTFKVYTLSPVELNLHKSSGNIVLNWTKNINPDFESYEVLRAVWNDYEYFEVARIYDENMVQFVDDLAPIGTAYKYFIRLNLKGGFIDSNIQTGEPGDLLTSVPKMQFWT